MVGIIIGLKHCQLGKEILDKLVLIMKKMILDLDAQTSNINQLKNTQALKMAWCQKMKNSFLISICLKKITFCIVGG